MDYLHVQADNPWYNYYLSAHFVSYFVAVSVLSRRRTYAVLYERSLLNSRIFGKFIIPVSVLNRYMSTFVSYFVAVSVIV